MIGVRHETRVIVVSQDYIPLLTITVFDPQLSHRCTEADEFRGDAAIRSIERGQIERLRESL